MPYLFNGKELDQETNLTYFGARYLDMKTSLWLNTDPLSGYNPIQETEHYIDGQHNGGIYNPMNMATYSYTYQNPIKYIDPNGKQSISNILVGRVTKSTAYFQFKPATFHLLSIVSGVDESLINNAIIAQTGAPLGTSWGIPVPSYDPNEGGGAMTLPDEYGL